QLHQLAIGVELHEHLVLRRAAQRAIVGPPVHRRAAAHPDLVVLRHVEAPRHHNVAPDVEQLARLVEDLHAHVISVGDVEPALAVHADRVRDGELPRFAAQLAPLLDELARFVEMHDAGIAVAVRDEYVSGAGDRHVGRLVEVRLVAPGHPLGADGQEQLASGVHFWTTWSSMSASQTFPSWSILMWCAALPLIVSWPPARMN